jgi:NarL family two-component system response regulator LiaR
MRGRGGKIVNTPIRVLVVDDHPLVRRGIVAVLEIEDDLEVAGECSDGEEAVQQALHLRPDVILMDLVMPKLDGISAIQAIKARQPEIKILVLTSFNTADMVFPSLNAGASGYLLKDSDSTELVRAIHQVYRGEASLHPTVARQVLTQLSNPEPPQLSPVEQLTGRELDALRLIARGLSNQEIARRMEVSEATVHTHVSKLLAKLKLTNRTQAALFALKNGLASLDDTEK